MNSTHPGFLRFLNVLTASNFSRFCFYEPLLIPMGFIHLFFQSSIQLSPLLVVFPKLSYLALGKCVDLGERVHFFMITFVMS